MIPYKVTSYDLKGSIKPQDHGGRMQDKDIELPEGAIPIGFDIIIKDIDTGNQYTDWWFYSRLGKDPDSSHELQREWVDDAHTEFVCIMDGKLKRFKVITRVYIGTKDSKWKYISVSLNPEAYIGTNIKEGTTKVWMELQQSEGSDKVLVVMWDDGEHHEVRFPIYLLEAQSCQK